MVTNVVAVLTVLTGEQVRIGILPGPVQVGDRDKQAKKATAAAATPLFHAGLLNGEAGLPESKPSSSRRWYNVFQARSVFLLFLSVSIIFHVNL